MTLKSYENSSVIRPSHNTTKSINKIKTKLWIKKLKMSLKKETKETA